MCNLLLKTCMLNHLPSLPMAAARRDFSTRDVPKPGYFEIRLLVKFEFQSLCLLLHPFQLTIYFDFSGYFFFCRVSKHKYIS
jgi:hypothetical protein